MAKAATPWGPAELVEELTVPQQAGEKRFASKLQLLETAKGERLVRFSYSGPGGGVRGPVTLRARDIGKLKTALAKYPGLSERSGCRRIGEAALCRAAALRVARLRPQSADSGDYRASLRPCLAAPSAPSRRAPLRQSLLANRSERAVARGVDERREDERAVVGAEQRIDGVLWVRHESHDVPRLVADAGDCVDGAVRVVEIAEDDLRRIEVGRRDVAAVAVLDRDRRAAAGRRSGT